MKRGSKLIRESQELRRELGALMRQIDETGYAAPRAQHRKKTAKHKTAK